AQRLHPSRAVARRHARGLRARCLRRLYDSVRWRAYPLLPHVRRPGRRSRDNDGREPRRRREVASVAAGDARVPRPAVRLLHPRHPDDHEGLPCRASVAARGREPRGAVRQSLPVHRLPAYRRCDAAGGQTDGAAMTTRYFGAPVKRNEDRRLLTGKALFIDDVELPGLLHAAFLRSQMAHARIKRLDVAAARNHPGVVAVFTADDLGSFNKPGPLVVSPPPIKELVFNARTQTPLARDKVRHVGEAVAVVIAESRYIAEDALADIELELEPLPAVVDLERAI